VERLGSTLLASLSFEFCLHVILALGHDGIDHALIRPRYILTKKPFLLLDLDCRESFVSIFSAVTCTMESVSPWKILIEKERKRETTKKRRGKIWKRRNNKDYYR
jgi:hypothetical protein